MTNDTIAAITSTLDIVRDKSSIGDDGGDVGSISQAPKGCDCSGRTNYQHGSTITTTTTSDPLPHLSIAPHADTRPKVTLRLDTDTR